MLTRLRSTSVAFITLGGLLLTTVVSALATSTIVGTTGSGPRGIVIDNAGNIYTANGGSNNISKITPSGASSIHGITGRQPVSIVIDLSGNLFIPNNLDDTVIKMRPDGTISATYPTVSQPNDIAIDSMGNVYVSHGGIPGSVTKIDPSGNVTNTALPVGSVDPIAIAVDTAGNVYTANFQSNNVSKIPTSGSPTIFASTDANPYDITVDAAGNVYTANQTANTVTKISPDGTAIRHGNTGRDPVGIAVDPEGNVYTTNFLDATVTRITAGGESVIYGTTEDWPFAITIDSLGNIYVTNSNGSDSVTKLSRPTPTILTSSISVIFDTRGGSIIPNGVTINGGSVTDPGSPTRDGFTFTGWNTAANGTGTAITFPYHHTNSSDFTLYAQWRANSTVASTTVPPTTVVTPLTPTELPSTGNNITLWPLLLIAAGFILTTLRRLTHSR